MKKKERTKLREKSWKDPEIEKEIKKNYSWHKCGCLLSWIFFLLHFFSCDSHILSLSFFFQTPSKNRLEGTFPLTCSSILVFPIMMFMLIINAPFDIPSKIVLLSGAPYKVEEQS